MNVASINMFLLRWFALLSAVFLIACMKPEFVAQDCSGGGPACVASYAVLEMASMPPASSKPNYPVIFLTSSTYAGFSVGTANNADSQCNSHIPSGVSGSFKAMLIATNTGAAVRRASQTANAGDGQLDWVFRAKQFYMRPDGTVIGQTTSTALFSFPLQNSFGSSGSFWTGLQSDWRSTIPCNDGNGTSWGASGTALSGSATAVDSTSISNASTSCSSSLPLLCVEQ